jgi:DNA-binding transcriptional ArsR family regulator
MLSTIIPSKTRRKILELFFHNFGNEYYLRDIVRIIDEEVNGVKRELDILEKGKILHKEPRLNKVFYSLNKNYIFFDEFLKIFSKTLTLSEKIIKLGSKVGKAKFVVLSEKYIRKLPITQDEIYLLFVGTIVIPEIEDIIKSEQEKFGSEINFSVMNEEEFTFRKRNNDPFLSKFLSAPKVMLVGSELDFMK